jgi:hypothetical protein
VELNPRASGGLQSDGHIRYQPTKASAAAWHVFMVTHINRPPCPICSSLSHLSTMGANARLKRSASQYESARDGRGGVGRFGAHQILAA